MCFVLNIPPKEYAQIFLISFIEFKIMKIIEVKNLVAVTGGTDLSTKPTVTIALTPWPNPVDDGGGCGQLPPNPLYQVALA